MDLTDNASVPISSFNGGQANWFIAVNNGQVTNPSGTNYYDKIEFRLDRPGHSNEGWGPENVAGSDGGPYGLHGRDGGANPSGGSHQLRGSVWKGTTLIASKTLNFSINSGARLGIAESPREEIQGAKRSAQPEYRRF